MKKLLLTATLATAAAIALAPLSHADPGCQSQLWGFLGSQERTICDGPVLADGSWMRARVIWVPAHQVPFTCYYGTYSSSCSGGYFVRESVVSADKYPVTPDDVLPDEPGHLDATGGTGLYQSVLH